MKTTLSRTRRAQGKKGFTLVELVIVIAVLAVIAVIAIPTVNNVIENANQAARDSNAQSIELTLKTFDAQFEAKMLDGTPAAGFDGTKKVGELLQAYGLVEDITKLPGAGTGAATAYAVDTATLKVFARVAVTADGEVNLAATDLLSTLGLGA